MGDEERKTKKTPDSSREKTPSSQKQCEEEILDSEKRYEALLDHHPVGVYRTTPDGKIIEANQAMVEILGCRSEEELKDVNVKSLYIKQDDRTKHLEKLESKKTHFAEFELKCMDGRIMWGRDYPRAVIGASGAIEYYDGILVDITSQKMAEEKRRKQNT